MTDYKSMYTDLFKAVTESIEILKQAQIKAENTYIDTSEPDKRFDFAIFVYGSCC